ncbi:MAG: DUF4924 family protein [Bacteroidaceae bacterium]|nr:DUF4924 family protein [Bacteroidaceae bacterium]
MYISQRLRQTNIAEWIIYMWQVEDVIRAFGLDIDRIESEYLTRFDVDDEQLAAMTRWYGDLIDMMRDEGCQERGHLQVVNSALLLLTDLHLQLLASTKYPFYSAAYYKALPFIVEVRSRGGDTSKGELESALEALYGVMLLRIQGKTVSKETSAAVGEISRFLGMLADYYIKDKNNELEL